MKAGYVEEWQFHKYSYSGTPQGGIISSILANIYLGQNLDKYIKEYIASFDKREENVRGEKRDKGL